MFLSGFFDESIFKEANAPIAVAGYVFSPTKYKQFCRQWKRMLSESRLTHFHTTDLIGGYDEFAGRSLQSREAVLRRAVDIILATMTVGAGARYSQSEFEALAPGDWPQRFGGHYSMMCYLSCHATQRALRRRNNFDKVFYTFELGHLHAHEADVVLHATIRDDEEATDRLQYHGHTFLKKKTAYGLQAADLLAWSSAKEMVMATQTREEIKVPPVLAQQIVRLLMGKDRYSFVLPTTEELRSFIETIWNLPNKPNAHVGPRKRSFRAER